MRFVCIDGAMTSPFAGASRIGRGASARRVLAWPVAFAVLSFFVLARMGGVVSAVRAGERRWHYSELERSNRRILVSCLMRRGLMLAQPIGGAAL